MDVAHYTIFRLEFVKAVAPTALGALSFALMAWTSGRVLLAKIRRPRLRPLGQLGTSELEFALALPWFLVSVLMTIQVTLLVNAMVVVDYAAYCAARSAIVWLPQNLPAEPANRVSDVANHTSEKWLRVRRAASLGCVAISPKMTTYLNAYLAPYGWTLDSNWAGSLKGLAGLGESSPNQPIDLATVGISVAEKWAYSYLYTDVWLLGGDGNPKVEFPGDSPVTAEVVHTFHLNVPFADFAMATIWGGKHTLGPYYIRLKASYTLQMAHA